MAHICHPIFRLGQKGQEVKVIKSGLTATVFPGQEKSYGEEGASSRAAQLKL